MGGADVSLGVFALLIVRQATHDELLSALAFSIGFIALTLANSELFTENFLVPIVAVAAKKASLLDLVRLWGGTAAPATRSAPARRPGRRVTLRD